MRRLQIKNSFGLPLGTGMTAANRPDPNTLGITSPYGTATPSKFNSVSNAWTTQGVRAIFPKLYEQQIESATPNIWFAINPSVPGAIVQLAIWFYHKEFGVWIQPASGASATYSGTLYADFIDETLVAPIYFQVVSISAGTVDISVDEQTAEVL